MGKIQTLLGEISRMRVREKSAEAIVAERVEKDDRSEGPKELMQA